MTQEKTTENWTITTTILERIRIIGAHEDGVKCLEWLATNGYNTIRSGVYTDRKMFPKVDMTRFLIVAEREVQSKEG